MNKSIEIYNNSFKYALKRLNDEYLSKEFRAYAILDYLKTKKSRDFNYLLIDFLRTNFIDYRNKKKFDKSLYHAFELKEYKFYNINNYENILDAKLKTEKILNIIKCHRNKRLLKLCYLFLDGCSNKDASEILNLSLPRIRQMVLEIRKELFDNNLIFD